MTDQPAPPGALFTDLYQLTMLHAYQVQGLEETATFELFVRRLPPERRFLLAAGLEQALDFLAGLHVTQEEIRWLADSGLFPRVFLDSLGRLQFAGDVYAMPEGTPFFANEPILRVTAPLPQAQLVESRLINILNMQSMIASKAARAVMTAPGKFLVDFGFRRSHGAEASLFAARASYLAGFDGSATVAAGRAYGIPLFGTMAHSFVQAHDSELQAFLAFGTARPQSITLLIDTYDTEQGAHQAVTAANALRSRGIDVKAVRIDSGNLLESVPVARRILDAAGHRDIKILCSGNLDEYKMQTLLAAATPVDGFGLGTQMNTSFDAPSLEMVYKLTEYAGVPRFKRSRGKLSWPGRKQVWRQFDSTGQLREDTVTLDSEPGVGTALLEKVMARGERLHHAPSLAQVRERTLAGLEQLPPDLRELNGAGDYPVHVSPRVSSLLETAPKLAG